jgi:hypothetical protein
MLFEAIRGFMGQNASDRASRAQMDAHRDAMAMQERMYNQQRSDQQPWRDAGGRAISAMENPDFQRDFTMNDFQQDPGYAFRMQQGQQALERSKAAKGLLGSGGTLKALTDYGQNMGAQEYQSAYNRFNSDRDRRFGRLSTISGMGQNAANATGAAAQNYANQYGQNAVGIGDARAGGIMAANNNWANELSKEQENIKTFATMGMGGIGGMMGGGGGGGGGGMGNWMGMWKQNQGG